MPEKVATISPLSHIETEVTHEPVAKPSTRAAGAAALEWPHGDRYHDNVAPGVAPASTPEQAVAPLTVARPVTSSQSGAYSKPRDSVQQADKSAGALGSPEPKHAARPSVPANPVPDQKAAPSRVDKPVATAAVESISLKLSRGLRVLHLEELPPEVRRDVPKISATGYVYSADTGVRVVNVNERSLQEGDELMAGLKLELIAPDHVLFSFRGYRFRVEMF